MTFSHIFGCSREQGALLFLGKDAQRLHCKFNTIMPRYMAANYMNWCQFAKSKNFNLEDGLLEGPLLIRGITRTSGWGVAAWVPGRDSGDLTVSISSTDSPDLAISLSTTSSSSGPHYRHGPPPHHVRTPAGFTPPPTPRSASISRKSLSPQCAFMSYYKAKPHALAPEDARGNIVQSNNPHYKLSSLNQVSNDRVATYFF